VTTADRDEIKRAYRRLRFDAGELTQVDVELSARLPNGRRLPKGRYWKLENGIENPTDDERDALARVFSCQPDQIPVLELEHAR